MEHVLLREYIPTTLENVNRFALEVSEERSQLAEVDAKLNALRAQLHLEQTRRDELERSIRMKQSLCAPIHRMPAELLGSIFEHCSEPRSSSDDNDRSVMSPHNPPLIFTQVCWRWRSVALATSGIWKVVNITRDTLQRHFLNLPLVLPFWTAHSHHNIDMFICDLFNSLQVWEGMREDEFQHFLTLLGALLKRCRTLAIEYFHSEGGICSHLIPTTSSFPILQELRFGQSSQLLRMVIHAPNLQTLEMECALYTADVLDIIPSSFRSLHSMELALNPVTGPDLLDFLAMFPELRRLTCDVFAFHGPLGTKQVAMNHLILLNIRWDDSSVPVAPLFNPLLLPSLQELSLRGDSVSSGDGYEQLVLLSNSSYSHTLTSLTLELWDLAFSIPVWQLLPVLENLYLRGCCGLGPIFNQMSKPMADGSWLCHKLREIVLYGWSPVFLKGVLPQIAAARGLTPGTTAHEGVGQLQLVAAWVYPEVEDDFVIREIEEIGVTVCMRTDDDD